MINRKVYAFRDPGSLSLLEMDGLINEELISKLRKPVETSPSLNALTPIN